MIGDGVTDMEARPPAVSVGIGFARKRKMTRDLLAQDLFIGFGGNVVRDKVRDGCDWFAKSFAELTEAFGEVDGGGY